MQSVTTRDYVVLFLIVVGSLGASAAWSVWQVRELVEERGPHFSYMPGPRYSYSGAALWKGDLWFSESLQSRSDPQPRSRVHRKNLATGETHATGLTIEGQWYLVFAVFGDRLWAFSSGTIYETDGQTILRTLPEMPASLVGPGGNPTLRGNYFELNGVLTSVREYQPDRFRLMKLIDREWVDGEEVILPGLNRQWADNETTQRKELLPRTCLATFPAWTPVSSIFMNVVVDQGHVHLFVFDAFRTFMAYREGFEFRVPNNDESANAQQPENAPAEATGWEYVAEKSIFPILAANTLHGIPMFSAQEFRLSRDYPTPGPLAMWTRTSRDHFQKRGELSTELDNFALLLNTAHHDECYLLGMESMQGAKLYAVEETGVRKRPVDLPGSEWPLIHWHVRLALVVIAAWVIHLVLTCAGMGLFLSPQGRVIEAGHDSVALAPIPRRAIARSLDMALVLLPMVLYVAWIANTADPLKVALELQQQESRVKSIPLNNLQGNYIMLVRDNAHHFIAAWKAMQWSLLCSMGVWFTFAACEGAWGMTPGKWLCRLRTLSTTLRPCGLLRVLVRDALLCVDATFLLTPIPAAIACISSPHRQRFGDRIADTAVVDANLLRTNSSNNAMAVPSLCFPSQRRRG